MATLRSQVVLPYFTGIPKDVITNTHHWLTDDSFSPAEDAVTIASRLEVFYEDAMDGFAANHVSWSLGRVKVYDLGDPEPRPPVADLPLNLNIIAAVSTLPNEVAVVVSYHADPVPGVNPGRLRNRFYLGGFTQAIMSAGSGSSFPIVSNAAVTQIAGAAAALLLDNTTPVQWVVASRATGLTITSQISGGWVDNEPDTQRRRGVPASARTLWG